MPDIHCQSNLDLQPVVSPQDQWAPGYQGRHTSWPRISGMVPGPTPRGCLTVKQNRALLTAEATRVLKMNFVQWIEETFNVAIVNVPGESPLVLTDQTISGK